MRNLYRKYRPLSLDSVVGQEQVTKLLKSSLEAKKINHAYLFVGPRGCGKTSVARILAHEVNGFKYETEDDYVDIIEIDGASNRGIDNIRELREKVMIAPTSGKYKVYIIDEVHMLTKEAFNALLKTLEEPPEHAIFIMATTDAYKVPVTITSRAQTYTFKLADRETMFKFLKEIVAKEKMKIDDEALQIIVKRGGGSFRDSLSLLDQISTLSDKLITKELVISAMGLPEDEDINKLLDSYQSCDLENVTLILKNLLSSGIKPETLVEELITTIVAQPKAELMPLLAKLSDIKAPFIEAKLLVALANVNLISSSPMKTRIATQINSSSHSQINQAAQAKNTNTSRPQMHQAAQLATEMQREVSSAPTPEQKRPQEDGGSSSSNTITNFDWKVFLGKIQGKSEAVYLQLTKSQYRYIGGELHIYPMRKIVKNILARENNKRILISVVEGVKITIHEADETPEDMPKDEVLTKISDIMGGEVMNDGGDSPF